MTVRLGVAYYATLSAIAAALLLAVTFLHGPASTVRPLDRSFVGAAFLVGCAAGIAFAVRPGWYRRAAKTADHSASSAPGSAVRRRRQGHHPDCGHFSAHVLRTGRGNLCAGCTGLAAGSVASIPLAVAFVSIPTSLPTAPTQALVLVGMALVAANFGKAVRPPRSAAVHAVLDFLLVIGFLLVVAGVFYRTGTLAYGAVGVTFSVLWLDTRVRVASWRHAEACRVCPEPCKAY